MLTNKIPKWPLEGSLIIVSDVHLKEMASERAQLFLDFLDRLSYSDIDNIILLGDIFDFVLGSKEFFREKYATVLQGLVKLTESGKKVVFFEGNHEFYLSKFFSDKIEVIAKRDYTLILDSKRKIKLSHGDLVYSHWRYRTFRFIVKSKLFLALFSLLPNKVIDYITSRSSDISRSHDQHRKMNHDKILNAVASWMDEDESNYGVFGHFHHPYVAKDEQRKRMMLGLDSWDKCYNALLFGKESDIHRIIFSRDKEGRCVIESCETLSS